MIFPLDADMASWPASTRKLELTLCTYSPELKYPFDQSLTLSDAKYVQMIKLYDLKTGLFFHLEYIVAYSTKSASNVQM